MRPGCASGLEAATRKPECFHTPEAGVRAHGVLDTYEVWSHTQGQAAPIAADRYLPLQGGPSTGASKP
jgi:hypothetical protein